ncbi:hypothetical protein G9P44_004128 [Scheffersomyces stipitis]|nr:hypothetical protein G9P44_004128 [Scheffersomyces stipitis]
MVGITSPLLDVNVMGLNSGTSIDGIDVVLCNFKQSSVDSPLHLSVLKYDEMDMPPALKSRVLRMIKENKTKLEEVSEIAALLGMAFAKAADDFCQKHGIEKSIIDIIGSHGQTIWYVPDSKPGQCRSVITSGEACYIAEKMGKTVVSEFRISEQSVGRQGAPMIAFFDSLLLVHPKNFRICQNIGGIANVCFVFPEKDGGLDKCFDYDTGPGNVFIDAAMRYFTKGTLEYDRDGKWGKRGVVHLPLVDEFLTGEYFLREPPKTTGRELFGDSVAFELIENMIAKGLSKYDIIATLTRITAQSIVNEYHKYSSGHIDEIFLCGGGALNPNITEYIQSSFPDTKINLLDVTGISGSAKESITFAFQGLEAILGRSLIIPDRVDSRTPVVVGKVTPGKNYRALQKMAVEFTSTCNCDGYLPSVRKMVIDRNA